MDVNITIEWFKAVVSPEGMAAQKRLMEAASEMVNLGATKIVIEPKLDKVED